MSATPVNIRLRKALCLITLEYEDGTSFDLPFEYLRVFSSSAEVQGHEPGQGVLQTGKENVRVESIEPIGHYALRFVFDDGHDTGLYTWEYLYELGTHQADKWQDYLGRLKAAGHHRDRASLPRRPREDRCSGQLTTRNEQARRRCGHHEPQ